MTAEDAVRDVCVVVVCRIDGNLIPQLYSG